MKLLHIVFFICVLVFINTFSACRSAEEQQKLSEIEQKLEMFLGTEICFGEGDLIGFRLPDTIGSKAYLSKEYKIVVYIDSLQCSDCQIVKLNKWTDFLRWNNTQALSVVFIFNTDQVQDVLASLDKFEIDIPAFFDINNTFQSLNKQLPKEEILRTFLTHRDTVVLAGIPFESKELEQLYINLIK